MSKGAKSNGNRPRVVHCRREPYDVYVGRPSKWGNPFHIVAKRTRREVIEMYREWLLSEIKAGRLDPKRELRGKVLGCWCSPLPCHGDVLLEIANGD